MTYRITSNYGWRNHPDGSGRKFHAGIDIVWYHKAPIKPFIEGKVIYSGVGKKGTGVGGYGNVVVVEDIFKRAHVYAHLDSVNVKVNEFVSINDTIGYQGDTGKFVTGSHLHYEIRKKSSPSLGWTRQQENSTINPNNSIKNKGSGRVVVTLKVDGKRGQATIKRWQQFLGTPVDGKLSKPSTAIKTWQTFLNKYGGANLKVDGYEGVKTIKAGQKFFGTKQDGVISNVSAYIKALQTFLNNYGR